MCTPSLMARCTEALVCCESACKSGRAVRRMSICESAEYPRLTAALPSVYLRSDCECRKKPSCVSVKVRRDTVGLASPVRAAISWLASQRSRGPKQRTTSSPRPSALMNLRSSWLASSFFAVLRRMRGTEYSFASRNPPRKEQGVMDLAFTPEELAFRDEVRAFLEASLPAATRRKVLEGHEASREETRQWQRILFERGWGGPNWPREFGGTGWDPVRQSIFEEESAAAGAPRLLPFGLKMVGPVIMRFGNAAQQKRFLPRILSGEDWWAQGYSEPGSGSDLASLKTRAERSDGRYLVNGQKTWITLAQHANWIFCLVRTDPAVKKQAGISFLLIDMKSRGVTVRPITLLDGSHEVNEVWFEDVEVPFENLVGDENSGWTYAKFLLGHERTNIAGVGASKRELARLKRIASEEIKDGKPLLADPGFAARVAQVEIDLMALEITNLRVLAAEAERRAPGAEASLLKIKGTEIQQALSELMMQAVGPRALPSRGGTSMGPAYASPLAATYLNLRKTSIYGGSNEIQKNIIAQTILGI